MKEKINKIRELLDLLEVSDSHEEKTFKDSFELFELPEIIESIVDFLQPLLLPYESAIYWFMFRHCIVKCGDNNIRVSVRGLAKSVIKSSSGQSTELSYGAVQNALLSLDTKKVIQKTGDTTREGTLYRIFLPEEIEICQERMKQLQIASLPKIDPKKEMDFYNIKENREKIFERDAYKCHYCGKQLTRFSATLDHIQPISKGGDNSFENLITSCLHCNSRRGYNSVMDAILKTTQE